MNITEMVKNFKSLCGLGDVSKLETLVGNSTVTDVTFNAIKNIKVVL